MTTNDSTTCNAATLNCKISAIVDQLASATDAARVSETMSKYLEFSPVS